MSGKMNHDLFEALALLEKEKGIPVDSILDNIRNAITVAVKKYYLVNEENIVVEIDPVQEKFKVAILKEVVEEVTDEHSQITLEEAHKRNKRMKIGSMLTIKLDTKQIGRIAAQSGKNLIHQAINEAMKEQALKQYQSKLNEVVTAVVQKVEPRTGNATISIDKNEVLLFKNEQIPGEELVEGQRIKVYVNDVICSERRCSLRVSRATRELVKRLFEQEVPEIFDGSVEVKAISREAGSRTKIAVYSKDPNIDPVGSCIGAKGIRVTNIVKELNGEKIDVVRYSEVPEEFIAQALAPSDVVSVKILDEENHVCRVTVPDHQLSLAIGNRGQNAKLAAKLTGYKIDIRPESGFYGEDEEEEEALTQTEEEIVEVQDDEMTEEVESTAEETAEEVSVQDEETADSTQD